MPGQLIRGRLRKYHSNYYYVEVEGQVYECFLKGLLKKALKTGSQSELLLVGDWVQLDSVDANNKTGRIVEIENRQNTLTRPKIANVDQALIVYPVKQPEFDPHLLDRFLTQVAMAGIPASICFSKIDLADSDFLNPIKELYQGKLGYPVLLASTRQPETIQAVFETFLKGKLSVLAGPSGAGKSSLLNTIVPDLKLRVGEVSEKIERGQHTTRHVELLDLPENTLIADTPGFSHLKFDQVLPTELVKIYPEFNHNPELQCEFKDCLHILSANTEKVETGEPEEVDAAGISASGCAYLDPETSAPDVTLVSLSRYVSYRDMMGEAQTYKQAAQQSSQKEEYGFKRVSNKGQEISILRLKEKNREASRRTQRQQVQLLETEEGSEDSNQDI